MESIERTLLEGGHPYKSSFLTKKVQQEEPMQLVTTQATSNSTSTNGYVAQTFDFNKTVALTTKLKQIRFDYGAVAVFDFKIDDVLVVENFSTINGSVFLDVNYPLAPGIRKFSFVRKSGPHAWRFAGGDVLSQAYGCRRHWQEAGGGELCVAAITYEAPETLLHKAREGGTLSTGTFSTVTFTLNPHVDIFLHSLMAQHSIGVTTVTVDGTPIGTGAGSHVGLNEPLFMPAGVTKTFSLSGAGKVPYSNGGAHSESIWTVGVWQQQGLMVWPLANYVLAT